MIYHIWRLFQMTAKCLLRSKAFIFFVFILPFVATLILNIKETGTSVHNHGSINELDTLDTQIAYLNDYSMMSVKVYDQSNSKTSTLLLQELQRTGMYQIFRINASTTTDKEIQRSIKDTAKKDKVGAVLYLSHQFDNDILAGNTSHVSLYKTSDDERYSSLSAALKVTLQKYVLLGEQTSSLPALQAEIKKTQPQKVTLQKITSDDGSSLFGIDVDYANTGVFGNVLAILTISFMMSGILILGSVLKERNSLVLTRILLSNASNLSYLLSKFIMVFFTTIIQTIVSVLTYALLVKCSINITLYQFAFIIFLLGLLFNSISICIGIFAGSSITTLYLSFIVWMITALLGGMYFDISNSSETFQRIAMLMPQRWGLKAASLFMTGSNSGYFLLLVVTFGYLLVIMIASIIGLRMDRKE